MALEGGPIGADTRNGTLVSYGRAAPPSLRRDHKT